MNKTTPSFTSHVADGRDVQRMLKALKAAGLDVAKDDAGYVVRANNLEVFRAMKGRRGYLVRHVADLWG